LQFNSGAATCAGKTAILIGRESPFRALRNEGSPIPKRYG
jgi:hypothetical protein